MAQIDFDVQVARQDTASLKWDKYKGRSIIPLWLADMDFRSSTAVIEALHHRVEHGVFGYTVAPEELVKAVVSMLDEQYQWKVHPDWLVWLPGLVTGLNVVCRAVGENGDDVMTAVPVYPPFLSAPVQSCRNLITVRLADDKGRWTFDFDGLEQAITPRTRLFLLCNPHNPVGRLYSVEELKRLAEICVTHDVVICSDEIHCGLVLDRGRKHVPMAAISHAIADRTITLMSPSKTFNLPGLGCSFAVIPNEKLRNQFIGAMAGIVPHVNVLGYTAALAAYRDSSNWHVELLNYLRKNRDVVEKTINQIPGLSMTHVEATYLGWIDARSSGLETPVKFFEEAGVGLFDGKDFSGPGFLRLNFGCPRDRLKEALAIMDRAMKDHLRK